MTNLIKDVQKEFPEFWDLEISINGVAYNKTYFDLVNVSLVLEHLIGNNSQLLEIVLPHDPTITIVSFIETLLSLLKMDVIDGDSEVLSKIKPGDKVAIIDERNVIPGIYIGIKKGSDGLERFYVKEDVKAEFPITRGIPFNLKWTIQPYNQSLVKQFRKQSEIYGEKLEKILNLTPGGLLAFQKSKMLLVTKNKSKIKEEILNVALGGDPLTKIFSIADYSQDKNFNYVGNDRLRREPSGGIVTNLDQAVDIALIDKSIRIILVDGASKLRSHFGSLERLKNDTDSCKVVCLLNAEDEDQIITLKNLGSQAWIWKRSDFGSMGSGDLPVDKGNPVAVHNNILNHIGGPDLEVMIVNQPQDLAKAIDSSFHLVTAISNKTADDPECAVLLRWAVSVINSMLQLPLPVSEYHNYLETLDESNYLRLDEKISSIENKVRSSYGFSVPIAVRNEWEELLSNIRFIYESLEKENPKWKALIGLAGEEADKTDLSVLILDDNYGNALKRLYPVKFRNILSGSEAGNTIEERVIITGWKNKKTAAKLFLAPYLNCIYLLYPQESQRYGRVLQTHPASPDSNTDRTLRTSQGMNKDEAKIVGDTDIGKLLDDLDQKLTDSLFKAHLQEFGEENMTDVRRVLFEESLYAYMTENQGLHTLNRENKSIEKCQVKNISPGDELVFVESQRDLFEDLISILKQSGQYKQLFSDIKQWHLALVRFMDDNFIDEKDLSLKLAAVGCNVGIVTLKSWISGELISPSESNLRALSKVISDSLLNNSLERIIESAREIHALHIQTGRLLVRKIVNAVVQDDDDAGIDEETKAKVEDYSRKAKIVTVREVLPDVLKIPAKAIGRLFEY